MVGVWILNLADDDYDYVRGNICNPFSNQNLFVFDYDWRKAIPDIAGRPNAMGQLPTATLAERLARLKSQAGHTKVDLVCHSMGGLVVKDYFSSGVYQRDDQPHIDTITFAGCPFRGSMDAYMNLFL